MKKIDKLLLGAFIGPFMMTFLVVVFILLTQHMLKYFDDIIGKGLGGDVIGQLLFYFAIFMTPAALPLAVLLSSLIAFGNLGEHFELTAIKSSGISLVRALRPIFFFVLFLTVVAFYANNNLVPKAALEAYSLLFDIKQKKPALDIRAGAFYNGITDISIKVNKKFEDGVTLKDVVVYDHRKNDGNREVTVADSGKMYTILNERYLKFELFKGYNYSESGSQQKDVAGRKNAKSQSLTRSKFDKSQIVFDLSDLDLKKTDKRWFQGNRIMRNLSELESDMDSIKREVLTHRLNYYQYQPSYFSYLKRDEPLPEELRRHQAYKDSLVRVKYASPYEPHPGAVSNVPPGAKNQRVVQDKQVRRDSVSSKSTSSKTAKPVVKKTNVKKKTVSPKTGGKLQNQSMRGKYNKKRDSIAAVAKLKPVNADSVGKKVLTDSARHALLDSLFKAKPTKDNLSGATNAARQIKTNIENSITGATNYEKELVIFEIQWHKILASSLACVAMFLIGAPLGAIIKKGGLGMPFLVSILFFIIYYVITMQGEKLAKTGAVSPAVGVWMADAILFVIGFLFLRQARADARLFEADFYNVVIDKLKTRLKSRKTASGPAPTV
jgi:lipopolysaccharide export system permease protein